MDSGKNLFGIHKLGAMVEVDVIEEVYIEVVVSLKKSVFRSVLLTDIRLVEPVV